MRVFAAVRTQSIAAALAAATVAASLAAAAPASAVSARAAQAACPAAAAAPGRGDLEQLERTTLCLVNLERRGRGLRRLRGNGRLDRAAVGHSRDMVRRDFFDHVSPGGASMADRIRKAGYLRRARSYAVAENIAWGTGSLATPLRIVRSWMRSPGHRANILNRGFEEMGVGVALGAPGQSGGGATYTTTFGAKG